MKRAVLVGLIDNPIVSEWWGNRMTPFSPDFVEEVEFAVEASERTWSHQHVAPGSAPAP